MSVYRSFLDELIKIAASWGLEKAQIATRGLNPTLMGVNNNAKVYDSLDHGTRKLIESHPMVTQHGMTPQAAMQVAGWSTKPGQSLGDFFAQQHLGAMKQTAPTPSSGFGAATNPGGRPAPYASATNPGGRPAPMQSGVMPTVRPPAPAMKAAPAVASSMKTVGPPAKALGGALGALPKPAIPSIGNAAKAAVKPGGGLGKIVGGFLQKAV